MKRKIRPLGRVTADIEVKLEEMVIDHEMQHGEILRVIDWLLETHFPDCRENYVNGDPHPIMKYGPHTRSK